MAFLDEHGLGIIVDWVKDTFARKGNLPRVAVSGSYRDLVETPEAATALSDGLMSSADKAKLDGIEAGAQVNVDGVGVTYELSQSEEDAHVIVLSGSDGSEFSVTVPDDDTVYGDVTVDESGLMTPEQKAKLDSVENGAQVNDVTGVKGAAEPLFRYGDVSISKADIGLGDVDDTADADKPLSSAQKEYVDDIAADLSSSIDGKADRATTLAGYGIADAMTSNQVMSAIDTAASSVYRYMGVKADASELPDEGNSVGDVWHVTADGGEHVWDGEAWEELGPFVDLSGYMTIFNVAGIEVSPDHNVVGKEQLLSALDLDGVENKSSSDIRSEITSADVQSALGYTPASSADFSGTASSGLVPGVASAESPYLVLRGSGSWARAQDVLIADIGERYGSDLSDGDVLVFDHGIGDGGGLYGIPVSTLGGGSTVSVSTSLGSGTNIGTITVDGIAYTLYAPMAGEAVSYDVFRGSTSSSVGTSGLVPAPSQDDASNGGAARVLAAGGSWTGIASMIGSLVGGSGVLAYDQSTNGLVAESGDLLSSADKDKLDSFDGASYSDGCLTI